MELLLLGIFAAVLLLCVFTGVTIIYAMILGLVLFFTYGLIPRNQRPGWKTEQQNHTIRNNIADICCDSRRILQPDIIHYADQPALRRKQPG